MAEDHGGFATAAEYNADYEQKRTARQLAKLDADPFVQSERASAKLHEEIMQRLSIPDPYRKESMSDHQHVKHAEQNLHHAKTEERQHSLDFWQRTAQAGRVADQTHIQTQKETLAEKPRQPHP